MLMPCVIFDISILLVSLVLYLISTTSYKMAMMKYILSNMKIYCILLLRKYNFYFCIHII